MLGLIMEVAMKCHLCFFVGLCIDWGSVKRINWSNLLDKFSISISI